MAVTITRAQLAARIRLGRTQTELDETDELLAYASAAVERHLGAAFATCPDAIANEAVYRLAGYIYDRPFASADTRFSNVLRNSGAASALLPYRVHRLGLSGGDTATAQGSAGNPVVDVQVVSGDLVTTFADGSTETQPLPAGGAGGGNLRWPGL